jgi:enamine deaminase RidA (YjgF/YER057c/UK114 family)
VLIKENLESKLIRNPDRSFPRVTRISSQHFNTVFVSGTGSVDTAGNSIYPDDFAAQAKRAYENIESLLLKADLSFKGIVSMTIYLKNIDKYYPEFNDRRDSFFKEKGVFQNPPSSTCIEAKLYRPELLIEMSAIALKEKT